VLLFLCEKDEGPVALTATSLHIEIMGDGDCCLGLLGQIRVDCGAGDPATLWRVPVDEHLEIISRWVQASDSGSFPISWMLHKILVFVPPLHHFPLLLANNNWIAGRNFLKSYAY